MSQVRIFAALSCLVLLLTIAVQNAGVVELRFLAYRWSISLVAVVFLAAGAGCVIGFVWGKLGGRSSKGPAR